MELFKKWNLKPLNVIKAVVVLIVGVALIALVFRLVAGPTLRPFLNKIGIGDDYAMSEQSYAGGYGGLVAPMMDGAQSMLSARNVDSAKTILPTPTPPAGPVGDTAEDYEVTDYSAAIETRSLEDTCGKITALKSRKDVIFENSSESKTNCNYSFKVKKAAVEEILAMIKELDPKDLTTSTYTLKQLADDYTSETEILMKKRASIDSTLENAIKAYDQITALATSARDAESLAKIIDSKIQIIERLTQERITINEQLDRLARNKTQQLDRLDYTYFNVSITEGKYVDGQSLKESWKNAVRDFVRDLNAVAQQLTVGLAILLFIAAQYVLYFLIVVVIVKYVWKATKKIWKR